jgi:hypothetical protein
LGVFRGKLELHKEVRLKGEKGREGKRDKGLREKERGKW